MQQRLDIQGMRALAISAVLLFHFFPSQVPNGFLGVDIFFVVSGYLILSIFSKKISSNGLSYNTILEFYGRRIRRLLPLYLFFCLVAVLTFTACSTPFEIASSQNDTINALMFITNIDAIRRKSDYFHSAEQRIPEDDVIDSPRVAVALLSFCIFDLFAPSPIEAFNSPFARLWQFLATSFFTSSGEIIPPAYPLERHDEEESAATFTRSLLKEVTCLLCSLALLVVLFMPNLTWQATSARLVVTATSAVLLEFGGSSVACTWLRLESAGLLGDISYSLYLFHWPFSAILMMRDAIGPVLPLLFSILVSSFVYYAFEKRYRTWTTKEICLTCMFLLGSCLAALFVAPQFNKGIYSITDDQMSSILENERVFENEVANLTPTNCSYDSQQGLPGNSVMLGPTQPFGFCQMPTGDGRLNFAIIGNSYAPDHAPLIWQHFLPFFHNFSVFSVHSCEPLLHTNKQSCPLLLNFRGVLDELQPDVTFVVQRYYEAKNTPIEPSTEDLLYVEMMRNLQEFEKRSSLVLVLDVLPSIDGNRMRRLSKMIFAGYNSRTINDRIVVHDEANLARPRTQKMTRNCRSCLFYDVSPWLEDSEGQFMAYDGDEHLSLFETRAHLTPHGRRLASRAYEALAQNQTERLIVLSGR